MSTTAIVVAHPGHELRVHHWLETNRPVVHCLTDGSGRIGRSRTSSTSKLLRNAGAREGTIFGRFTDREVYRALLAGECAIFEGVLTELTESLIAEGVTMVAGDAPEGANPTHDLCRCLIDQAVAAVERTTGRLLDNYEFVLDGPPEDCPAELRDRALSIRLDDVTLRRKLCAAHDYAELRGETEEALSVYGEQAFAVECLRPPTTRFAWERFEREPPPYEHYGREGVERFGKSFGGYEEVITYRRHVKPVIQAIEVASRRFVPRC